MKNFGLIKEGYVVLLAEAISTDNKEMKKAFRGFVKNVKSNPILKTQKNVFKLLENVSEVEPEFRDMYISESVAELNNIDTDQITTENVKLLEPLLEFGLDLTALDYEDKHLHECITNYIHLTRSPKTMKQITESKMVILKNERINESVPTISESEIVQPSTINTLMERKLKTKYADLSETELKIIKSVLSGNKTIQESIYDELKEECQKIVTELKNNNELFEFENMLNNAQSKLNEMAFNQESYVDDVTTLIELKELQNLTTN